MSPEELLQFLIENGRAWVQAQRNRHRPTARPLTTAERVRFRQFFEGHVLDIACVASVPVIPNPEFYANLALLGIPLPLDFTAMEGITFVDTILVSEREDSQREPLEPLLFHELVHVVQYRLLGKDAFVERYVRGWADNGQDYFQIPLEQDAYALQEIYEKRPDRGFSVEAEVRRRLGLA